MKAKFMKVWMLIPKKVVEMFKHAFKKIVKKKKKKLTKERKKPPSPYIHIIVKNRPKNNFLAAFPMKQVANLDFDSTHVPVIRGERFFPSCFLSSCPPYSLFRDKVPNSITPHNIFKHKQVWVLGNKNDTDTLI